MRRRSSRSVTKSSHPPPPPPPPREKGGGGGGEAASTPTVTTEENLGGDGERMKRRRQMQSSRKTRKESKWSVYLITSSRLPRTYVGVTTNFTRRLKQHNGTLKGGAKAACAGRPWSLACIIQGFKNRSEACSFESKWKSISRRTHRKKNEECASSSLLKHREAALTRVISLSDSRSLSIRWQTLSD